MLELEKIVHMIERIRSNLSTLQSKEILKIFRILANWSATSFSFNS